MKKPKKAAPGQVLVAVIVILVVVATLVPLMVFYTQREALWTAKHAQNTTAFHLAEAGTEKGYLAISQSTQTWRNLQNAIPLSGFQFDTAYSDLPGGTYAVSITSGPGSEQATIVSVGRDSLRRETRALKVVYSNSTLGGIAIYSSGGVQIGGNTVVHWGAVVSPQAINAAGQTFPQFWSSAGITGYDTDANPPNCDSPACCQWHAFATNIPPQPLIDLNFYKSSAQATGTYYSTHTTFSNFTESTGKTIYIDGNLTVGSPGIDILGSLIVIGNLSTTSGNWGKGTRTPVLPRKAWKQYCNDWSTYRPFDTTEPASFPGLTSTYQSPQGLTYSPTPNGKFAVSGLLYVQGNFSIGGGGGSSYLHGAAFVLGTSTMTGSSNVTFYYDEQAANGIQTSQIILTRESWQDLLQGWPSGL